MTPLTVVAPLYLLPPREHRARRLAVIILCLVPFLFGLLALALGQDANWDFRNYHWYNAYAFLNDRYAMDLLPSQTPYFYNPTLDVPFYLLATHVPAMLAGFILASVQGLNFVLLFMLSYACLIVPNQRHKVIVCAIMAAMGVLGAGGIAQLGTTFYDNITSLGIFASALLVLSNQSRLISATWPKAMLLALLFGLPAGLMMGLKLPSVIFCVGLCAALLTISAPPLRRVQLAFGFGCGVLIGVALSLGHWAWFLQTHFGSPLFPYFNDLFKSPLAPLASARDIQFIPESASDRLLFPFIFSHSPLRVGEIPWRDYRIAVLYVLLPLVLLLRLCFGRNSASPDRIAHSAPSRYLLWVAVISYVVWLKLFAIYRYLIPLEMLAPLLIVITIGLLPLKLTTRGMLAGFVLLVLAVTIQPGNWGRKEHWLAKAVEIIGPALPNDPKLMVLMAGYEPFSHVLTEFPPQISFLRIQSNFSSPEQDKGINQMIRERLNAHRAIGGHFKVLAPPWHRVLAVQALAAFDLTLLPQSCQTIDDHLYDKLELCDVATSTNHR